MRIFDRYVLQKFVLPFVYCFLVFIAILALAYVYIWRKGALEWK